MERHPADNPRGIVNIMKSTEVDLFIELQKGELDIEGHHALLQDLATRVDEMACTKYKEADLREYAGRMRLCMKNLQILKKNVEMQKQGQIPNWEEVIGAISYLMGELNEGLSYTVLGDEE